MKSFITSCLAATALASPLARRQSSNIDVTVLQFALTLEHLENVFYEQALKNYTLADFQKAGYSADYYNNLKFIAGDEQQHVKLLTSAIASTGNTPVAACTYSFPSTDVKSFITLSSVLEGVGTSAYLGAAPLITSKGYLTVAGSILVTEAIHTSYQRAAIGEVPFANPYGTPLDPTSAFTLAAAFIVSCPASNPKLPFTAFPSLTYNAVGGRAEEPDQSSPSVYIKREAQWGGWGQDGKGGYATASTSSAPPSAGTTISFTAAKEIPDGSYVTFVAGLTVTSVKGTVKNNTISAAIPSTVSGQTYVFVSKSDQETTFSDTAVLYGPSTVEINPPTPVEDFSLQ